MYAEVSRPLCLTLNIITHVYLSLSSIPLNLWWKFPSAWGIDHSPQYLYEEIIRVKKDNIRYCSILFLSRSFFFFVYCVY